MQPGGLEALAVFGVQDFDPDFRQDAFGQLVDAGRFHGGDQRVAARLQGGIRQRVGHCSRSFRSKFSRRGVHRFHVGRRDAGGQIIGFFEDKAPPARDPAVEDGSGLGVDRAGRAGDQVSATGRPPWISTSGPSFIPQGGEIDRETGVEGLDVQLAHQEGQVALDVAAQVDAVRPGSKQFGKQALCGRAGPSRGRS